MPVHYYITTLNKNNDIVCMMQVLGNNDFSLIIDNYVARLTRDSPWFYDIWDELEQGIVIPDIEEFLSIIEKVAKEHIIARI